MDTKVDLVSYLEEKPKTTVVHLQRRGGQLIQGCSYYIGRRIKRGGWDLPQSQFYNPFTVSRYGNNCIRLYIDHLYEPTIVTDSTGVSYEFRLIYEVEKLRGHTLGCWCKPNPCHGDVLVKVLEMTIQLGIIHVPPIKEDLVKAMGFAG